MGYTSRGFEFYQYNIRDIINEEISYDLLLDYMKEHKLSMKVMDDDLVFTKGNKKVNLEYDEGF
jgi:hypothetical protein